MAVLDACRLVDQAIRAQPAYAHTSHLLLEVDGQVVFDRHYRGPRVADVFSVTKSVVATLAGIAVAEGRLGDLDLPVGRALPALAGTPAAGWNGSLPRPSWSRPGPGSATTTAAPTCSAPP